LIYFAIQPRGRQIRARRTAGWWEVERWFWRRGIDL